MNNNITVMEDFGTMVDYYSSVLKSYHLRVINLFDEYNVPSTSHIDDVFDTLIDNFSNIETDMREDVLGTMGDIEERMVEILNECYMGLVDNINPEWIGEEYDLFSRSLISTQDVVLDSVEVEWNDEGEMYCTNEISVQDNVRDPFMV